MYASGSMSLFQVASLVQLRMGEEGTNQLQQQQQCPGNNYQVMILSDSLSRGKIRNPSYLTPHGVGSLFTTLRIRYVQPQPKLWIRIREEK